MKLCTFVAGMPLSKNDITVLGVIVIGLFALQLLYDEIRHYQLMKEIRKLREGR